MRIRSREGKGRKRLLRTLSSSALTSFCVLSMGIAASASGDVIGLTSEVGGDTALTIFNEGSSMEMPSAASGRWLQKNGRSYWYEGGVRQGMLTDPKGVLGDGIVRGREIYDPETDAWYWLDACYNGAKACDKEVWMPYIYQNEADMDDAAIRDVANLSGTMAQQVYDSIKARTGKWVRYDEEGRMYKGWYIVTDNSETYPDQRGNYYYYDPQTGLMAKGTVEINGKNFHFDEVTGVLISKDKEMVLIKEVEGNVSCISYEYDCRGFLVRMNDIRDPLAFVGYEYDYLGRKWIETHLFYRRGWLYDDQNRVIEEWYNHNRGPHNYIYYTYYENGLVKEKILENEWEQREIYSYKYDDRGREIECCHTPIEGEEENYRYEYEMLGDKEIKEVFFNGGLIYRAVNEYTVRNADGRVVEEVSGSTLYTYDYDEAGNLISAIEKEILSMEGYDVTRIGNSVQYLYEDGKIVTCNYYNSNWILTRVVDYVYGEV